MGRCTGGNAREGLCAAVPPLEALKLLSKGHKAHKLMFIDISKAFFSGNKGRIVLIQKGSDIK